MVWILRTLTGFCRLRDYARVEAKHLPIQSQNYHFLRSHCDEEERHDTPPLTTMTEHDLRTRVKPHMIYSDIFI